MVPLVDCWSTEISVETAAVSLHYFRQGMQNREEHAISTISKKPSLKSHNITWKLYRNKDWLYTGEGCFKQNLSILFLRSLPSYNVFPLCNIESRNPVVRLPSVGKPDSSSSCCLQHLRSDFPLLHEFHLMILIPQFLLLLQFGQVALFPMLPGLNSGKGYQGDRYLREIVVEGFESVFLVWFSHHALSARFPELQLQGKASSALQLCRKQDNCFWWHTGSD